MTTWAVVGSQPKLMDPVAKLLVNGLELVIVDEFKGSARGNAEGVAL